MRKLFYALALLATPALAQHNIDRRASKDGYSFQSKQWSFSAVTITLVLLADRKALVEEAHNRGIALAGGTSAFSVIHRPPNNTCTIYTIDPSYSWKPELLGHEVAHCFFGDWHQDETSNLKG